jgi:hypothetical protein
VTLPFVIPRNSAVRWIICFADVVTAYAALAWMLLLEVVALGYCFYFMNVAMS